MRLANGGAKAAAARQVPPLAFIEIQILTRTTPEPKASTPSEPPATDSTRRLEPQTAHDAAPDTVPDGPEAHRGLHPPALVDVCPPSPYAHLPSPQYRPPRASPSQLTPSQPAAAAPTRPPLSSPSTAPSAAPPTAPPARRRAPARGRRPRRSSASSPARTSATRGSATSVPTCRSAPRRSA